MDLASNSIIIFISSGGLSQFSFEKANNVKYLIFSFNEASNECFTDSIPF